MLSARRKPVSNILGICGSPVRGGSTELLVQETLKGAASAGAAVDYIFLNDLQIMPCQACGRSPEKGYCFFNDGMDIIYDKFNWCDGIVVGSPIYFDSVSAQTKLFIDRCNCFRAMNPAGPKSFIPRIDKKRRGGIILAGGERENYEYARRVIGGFYIWGNIESVGLVTYAYDGWEKGTVSSHPDIMRQAHDMGILLASRE
jgi:multimeric flavodoxin WrbA